MKKILLLILVVCGCALLLSCGSEQVDFSEKDSYISQYTNHEIGDALSHQSGSDIIAAPGEEDGVGTDVNTENADEQAEDYEPTIEEYTVDDGGDDDDDNNTEHVVNSEKEVEIDQEALMTENES
jgi:hypothetical protein